MSSVGYDIYNRYDLGAPGNPTTYGTLASYSSLINATHQIGAFFYTDYSMGHNGYSNTGSVDSNGNTFANAGGYPGFLNSAPGNPDGDFNGAYANNVQQGRLAGLDNINFDTNYQYIRNPTTPGNPANLPAGTTPAFGRIANEPMPANAQFYPQANNNPIFVYNPATGQGGIQVNSFNNSNPLAGSPTTENVTGYIMRNLQWYVQKLGVDGFRLDAVKNMEWQTALPYYNQAVYRSSTRTYLNGVQEQIYGFGEYYGSHPTQIFSVSPPSQYNPNGSPAGSIGTVHNNLNVLDFPLFFAMQNNLTANGYQNNWNNVVNASVDTQHNGTVGVKFVSSQDNGPPALDNVAYAYTLMLPGQALVYYNGNTNTYGSFPANGREDALGGVYGNTMANTTNTTSHFSGVSGLVDIRNRYSTGNYIQRYLTQNNFAFERQDSALVLLNNQEGGGNVSTTLHTDFRPGTYLEELTGNAANSNGLLPQLLQVNADQTVNVTFPNNDTPSGKFTGQGYLIYGPATPVGTLSLTNVASVMPGTAPSANASNLPYANGANRVSSVDVIKSATFNVNLQTIPVKLLGSISDPNASGDNALIRIDGGLPINGDGHVDFTTPNTVTYGYDFFRTKSSPLYGGGDGQFIQTINTAQLGQGYHSIEVIAFRHRTAFGNNANPPPLYTDWTQTIYVDTAPPVSAIESFSATVPGVNQNRTLLVKSVDGLANNIHVIFDLPAADTTAQILAMVNSGNQANAFDTNLWTINANGLTSGNHVATVITYKPDGTYNIQRFGGLYTSTIFGAGLGDLNFDGQYTVADVNLFGQILASNNTQFNPAADFDGDGVVGRTDLLLFGQRLRAVGAGASVLQAYNNLLAQYPGPSTTSAAAQMLALGATPVAVPEPASLALLAAGGGVTLLRRRRRC